MKQVIPRRNLSALGVLLAICLWPGRAGATAAPGHRPLQSVHNSPTNIPELRHFIDRFFAGVMAQEHVPGAVIAVVENGTVVYLKGYGYADVAERQAVSAHSTVFRVASLSKLFTATAVMQLAEKGKLHLHTDVNRYLSLFQLPKAYPQPVTLATLLTHTSGLGNGSIAIAASSPSGLVPLGPYLRDRLPPRVMPPGRFYSYTNWNFDLAGYIVQTVSHEPFARYVTQDIFKPLGMSHSTFVQPPPYRMGQRATGYLSHTWPPKPAPVQYMDGVPSAAMSTTAADMAHFLLAQLDGGVYRGRHLMKPTTLQEMHALHFRTAPGAEFQGMAYGFERWRGDGQLVLAKDGNLVGFGSYVALLPTKHLGFFIAGNTVDSDWMHVFLQQFVKRYYPLHVSPPAAPHAYRGSLAAFTGAYWGNTYAHDTIEKLGQLTNQVAVTDDGNGSITMRFSNGGAVRLTKVGPLDFRFVSGGVPNDWAFVRDADGHINHFFAGNQEFDRISWYQTAKVQEVLFAGFFVVFLLTAASWPVRRVLRRRQRKPGHDGTHGGRRALLTLARMTALTTCLLNVVFLLGLVVTFQTATATLDQSYSWINFGIPWWVYLLLSLPLITAVLALALPALAIASWRDSSWTLIGRASYAVVTVVALAFIPFLLSWNLLGFHV